MKYSRARTGRFRPLHPQKYAGDPDKIWFRSGMELSVMKYLDRTENVLCYASEEIAIPYIKPTDGKFHHYYPDFYVKYKTKSGKIKEMIWEVKPKSQTKPPKSGKKRTRRYLAEQMTWAVNKAKWEYCRAYCKDKGWEFLIMTEDHIL